MREDLGDYARPVLRLRWTFAVARKSSRFPARVGMRSRDALIRSKLDVENFDNAVDLVD